MHRTELSAVRSTARTTLKHLDTLPELDDTPSWEEISRYTGMTLADCRAEARAANPRIRDDHAARVAFGIVVRREMRRLRARLVKLAA